MDREGEGILMPRMVCLVRPRLQYRASDFSPSTELVVVGLVSQAISATDGAGGEDRTAAVWPSHTPQP